MEWDEIQNEFDRAYGMSCKPSGLQKHKAGHIFDENMSVKWNRDKLEEEKAETDAEKRRVEAQATADADLIAANAEAEKSKVAADAELYVAEKKAEANRALNDSLNSNLLEYYKITNVDSLWNGELPTYVGDGNSIPIINGIN